MSTPINSSGNRGSTPLGEPEPRKKRPWWLLLLLGVVVLVLLLLLLSRCGGDDSSKKAASGAGASASPSAAATPTPTPSPTPSASVAATTSPSSAASPSPAAGGGRLTAAGNPLLPLTTSAPSGSLAKYNGTNAQANGVRVLSVPANEGFWVGRSRTDRIWVQISGSGESPYQVKAGDKVVFAGTLVPNPDGFAKTAGVSPAEGAKQLTREGSHIQVEQGGVKLFTG